MDDWFIVAVRVLDFITAIACVAILRVLIPFAVRVNGARAWGRWVIVFFIGAVAAKNVSSTIGFPEIAWLVLLGKAALAACASACAWLLWQREYGGKR